LTDFAEILFWRLQIILVCGRTVLGYLITTDENVVAVVSHLLIVVALFQVFDGLQTSISAILRGMGHQRRVAILNLLGFWIIGIPVGAFLTFSANVGLIGLWWGLAAGLLSTCVFGAVMIVRVDWVKECVDASQRSILEEQKKVDREDISLWEIGVEKS
jgi:MATE family multidrug resistance protein